MTSRGSVDFVLVSWNTRDLTLRCVEDLLPQAERLGSRIVIVDNGSTDGTVGAISKTFPTITILQNQENLGFSRAANRGIRNTGANIIALLNNDLLLGDADLHEPLTAIARDPRIGALGCEMVDGDGHRWQYDNRFPTRLQIAMEAMPLPMRKQELHFHETESLLATVDWLAGACLFLRRSALEKVGLLEEGFFLYKEDVDLCLRMKRAGYRVVLYRGAPLTHLIAQSTKLNPGPEADRADIEALRSSVLYTRKHWGVLSAFGVACVLRLALAARLSRNFVLHLLGRRETERRKIRWMWKAIQTIDRTARGSSAVAGGPRLLRRDSRTREVA